MIPPARTLIVVPTGGCDRDQRGTLVPNYLGCFRLERAAQLLERNQTAMLAISGGQRANPLGGEAFAYYQSFIGRWPHLTDRVVIVDACTAYTAGDMAALANRITEWERTHSDIGRFATIIMVSHRDHAHLAILSLNAGFSIKGDRTFKLEESGEPACRNWGQQLILNFVTKRDPHWRKWFSWPLRIAAAREKRHL